MSVQPVSPTSAELPLVGCCKARGEPVLEDLAPPPSPPVFPSKMAELPESTEAAIGSPTGPIFAGRGKDSA